MSDLIDRQSVLKAIFQKPSYHNSEGSYYHADDIRKAVESIEASGGCEKCNDHSEPEREEGYWIPFNRKAGVYDCSVCGYTVISSEIKKLNYCPNCGSYNQRILWK